MLTYNIFAITGFSLIILITSVLFYRLGLAQKENKKHKSKNYLVIAITLCIIGAIGSYFRYAKSFGWLEDKPVLSCAYSTQELELMLYQSNDQRLEQIFNNPELGKNLGNQYPYFTYFCTSNNSDEISYLEFPHKEVDIKTNERYFYWRFRNREAYKSTVNRLCKNALILYSDQKAKPVYQISDNMLIKDIAFESNKEMYSLKIFNRVKPDKKENIEPKIVERQDTSKKVHSNNNIKSVAVSKKKLPKEGISLAQSREAAEQVRRETERILSKRRRDSLRLKIKIRPRS